MASSLAASRAFEARVRPASRQRLTASARFAPLRGNVAARLPPGTPPAPYQCMRSAAAAAGLRASSRPRRVSVAAAAAAAVPAPFAPRSVDVDALVREYSQASEKEAELLIYILQNLRWGGGTSLSLSPETASIIGAANTRGSYG